MGNILSIIPVLTGVNCISYWTLQRGTTALRICYQSHIQIKECYKLMLQVGVIIQAIPFRRNNIPLLHFLIFDQFAV